MFEGLCDKLKDATNKRLANIQSVFRSALGAALEEELIEINHLNGWKYTRQEAPKTADDVDPFDMTEQEAILNACRDPQHRNLFLFAFWSGLRTSELVALEWGDIDWIRGLVKVSRAKTQAADETEMPKTRKSTRDAKLLSPALEALKA
jgi:integrase